jgi:hypothetical protein
MAANTAPIYTLTPDVSTNGTTGMPTTITTATGDYTGISANHVLAHTAGANGSYVRKLRFKAVGTNVASVATNNSFIGEISLPAITATNAAATNEVDYPLEFALPASFRIYAGIATTVAAGWVCTAIAGQY